MGDRAVEQDVLAMFVQQALLVRERIVGATAEDRKQLAHGLKGSARGIGAFAIAECAAAIERSPADKRLMKELAARIDRACDFIAAISR
jgi:HPt (histidine-containing phosphotransfer) domain-containing protein